MRISLDDLMNGILWYLIGHHLDDLAQVILTIMMNLAD